MATPVGSMSATRVDFGPLLERLRMQLAQNQFGAQLQQQERFHQADANLAGLRLGQQESQFARDLADRQAQRAQQISLQEAAQALQAREMAQQAELARGAQELTRRGQDIGAAESAAAIKAQQERDAAVMAEREQARERQERAASEAQSRQDAVKAAVARVETALLPELEARLPIDEWGPGRQGQYIKEDPNRPGSFVTVPAKGGAYITAAGRETVVRAAKARIAADYANDPDAMLAALDRVNAWEDEQEKREVEARKAAQDAEKEEFERTARKWVQEDRKQARADKIAEAEEARRARREAEDARLLAGIYNSTMNRAIKLEEEAMKLEALGDEQSMAQAERLRQQADELSAKADAIGQKLGFFED